MAAGGGEGSGARRGRRADRRRIEPEVEPRAPGVPGGNLWIVLLLVAAIVAIYFPVLSHPFVDLDDGEYIFDNPQVRGGLTGSGIAWAFTTGHATNWHPLTWLSHMLDVQLFGLNPGMHHLTAVLLHIANSLLLFWTLERMTGARWRSAVVAALFAVHPLHVESVAWASERKDVLSTLLWMLTMLAYVEYARRPKVGRYLLVCLAFALGLMAKPMLVTLPLVMLLLDYWPLGRLAIGARRTADPAPAFAARGPLALVLEKLPLLGLVVVSSAVTVIVQWNAIGSADRFPVALRVGNALVSYAAYVGQTFWPVGLAIFYPYPQTFPVWEAAASLAGILVVSALVLWAAPRHPYLPVGWFWYLGTLVPVIGLVQVGIQARADRYTYIPLIGLFVMLAWGLPELLARWRESRTALAVAAVVALVACAFLASRQVDTWKSHLALWTHAVEVTRDNYRGHNDLGMVLAGAGKLEAAAAQFSTAVRIKRDYESGYNNLGLVLVRMGKLDEAVVQFREALRLRPDFASAHNNLGFALARLGRTDEAVREYAEAIRFDPGLSDAYNNRALALAGQGAVDLAIRDLHEAIRLRPHDAEFQYNLAALYGRSGRPAEAVRHYLEGIKLQPDPEAYYRLGMIFADQGRAGDAAQSFEAALRLNPRFQPAQRALADLKARR